MKENLQTAYLDRQTQGSMCFERAQIPKKKPQYTPPPASQNDSRLGIQDMKFGEKLATLDLRMSLTGHFLQITCV